mgnify:FL=1
MIKKPLFGRKRRENCSIAIIINAYYSAPQYIAQSLRLKEEFEKLGATADIVRNDGFFGRIDDDNIKTYFGNYSACVFLDKDKYLSEMLEMSGITIFNSHKTIVDCDDKMTTYIRLAGNGVSIPKTLPGLLCYNPYEQIREQTIAIIENQLGYPLVVKECYGSQGSGVYPVFDRGQLYSAMERVKLKPHLIQRMITSSLAKDVRVIVIGGKAVGAMLREGSDGFHSNVGQGGRGSAYSLSASFRDAAEKCAETLGADYCGVDLLFGETGEPIVCEVNSNAFFTEFERCTNINIAKLYAEYILDRV